MKTNLPTVSVIIPTLNEENNIRKCLDSIFRQTYPKKKLEVIVVDDKSTDRTIEIVKEFPVKVLISGQKHGEISKMIGFKEAQGHFAIYLDADNELVGKGWFQKMIKPLIEDKAITGAFTYEGASGEDSALERYLSLDPLQRDGLYQYFSPSVKETIEEGHDGYFVCGYKEGKIPPAGRCLYRREELLKLVSKYNMFLELDFLVILVRNGFNKFAYVPNAGLYHHHAISLSHLIKKRLYNLTRVYLAREERFYKWFDLRNPRDLIKIFLWVIYANLILPSIFVGIIKSIKYRDWAGMYEPVVNLLVTDLLIFEFLKDSRGWKLLLSKQK